MRRGTTPTLRVTVDADLTGMSLYLPDGIQIRLDSDSTNH